MPSSPDDLCVLADLKAWLNIQTSAEDTLLQNLITRGSLQMLRWMNRDHIIATAYSENRDGSDSLFILPRNLPLTSVSSVMVEGFAYVYRRRTHIGEDANSASGQVTISFSREMLPQSVLMTLEQYTRRALA